MTRDEVPMMYALNMQSATECAIRFHGLQDWINTMMPTDKKSFWQKLRDKFKK